MMSWSSIPNSVGSVGSYCWFFQSKWSWSTKAVTEDQAFDKSFSIYIQFSSSNSLKLGDFSTYLVLSVSHKLYKISNLTFRNLRSLVLDMPKDVGVLGYSRASVSRPTTQISTIFLIMWSVHYEIVRLLDYCYPSLSQNSFEWIAVSIP